MILKYWDDISALVNQIVTKLHGIMGYLRAFKIAMPQDRMRKSQKTWPTTTDYPQPLAPSMDYTDLIDAQRVSLNTVSSLMGAKLR